MPRLIDTNVWVALVRGNSPAAIKSMARRLADHPQACVAEPILFETMQRASDAEAMTLPRYFDTIPVLPSPPDLWRKGVRLGRACRSGGISPGSLDLPIAVVTIEHGATLVAFDSGFRLIGGVSGLKLDVLIRPPLT